MAAMLRFALRLVEVPYTLAVRWRNRRYDRHQATIHRVGVPVISVGNLTLGGTGKTPMVQWLAQWFGQQNARAGIVSRGYGAKAGSRNDEAMELEQKLLGVPHLQNPDRVAAARRAIAEHDCQLILLDDAFQHRRIARDLDIVLIDALEPLGFGHVFPRGTLREPLSGLRRADLVVLTRADMLTPDERHNIAMKLEAYVSDIPWIETAHCPQALLSHDGVEASLESLAGKRVAAFCGIGNPAGFRHTLDVCGFDVAAFREFPDHHAYQRTDLDDLRQWAESLDVSAVLCTHKDLVKLSIGDLGRHPLWAVTVGMEILAGRQALESRLRGLLEPK